MEKLLFCEHTVLCIGIRTSNKNAQLCWSMPTCRVLKKVQKFDCESDNTALDFSTEHSNQVYCKSTLVLNKITYLFLMTKEIKFQKYNDDTA
jgi:hypothetical protein